ncbi:hypothetical protein ACFR96_05245 [Microbulbifer halophilus]|uniref:hypothetical protein n=1 Tax=Microbulbifer halophilus TaxID=453963 RepID=UPI0022443A60|nr:hypothetical protein [Microbulbifer halophilus]
MKNIYRSPESDLNTDKYQSALDQIRREQSYILSVLSAVAATLSGLFLLSIVPGMAPVFVYLLPALLSSIAVKYIGRPFSFLCRVICAIVTALIISSVLVLYGVGLGAITVGFLSVLISLSLNRRVLTFDQDRALYRIRNGIGTIK